MQSLFGRVKAIIEHTQMYSPCCNNESGSDKQLTDALEDNRILYNTMEMFLIAGRSLFRLQPLTHFCNGCPLLGELTLNGRLKNGKKEQNMDLPSSSPTRPNLYVVLKWREYLPHILTSRALFGQWCDGVKRPWAPSSGYCPIKTLLLISFKDCFRGVPSK